MADPVTLGAAGIAGIAGTAVYAGAAIAQTGLAIWGFLTKERPAGLHRASNYTFDTLTRISKDLDAIQNVVDNFGHYAGPLIKQDELAMADQFVCEAKHVLHLLASQLSTTDNYKLTIAFQYLRLFIALTDEARYHMFWSVVDKIAVGNLRNLKAEVSDRHPEVFHKQGKGSPASPLPSRKIAVSSVFTGLFIGMNDWRSVFSGDLPGQLSANNQFQKSAKSPIQLLDISQGYEVTQELKIGTDLNAYEGLMRGDSASDSIGGKLGGVGAWSGGTGFGAGAGADGTSKGKGGVEGNDKQEQLHGRLIQMRIEGNNYLYQPYLTMYPPGIGKYFYNGTNDYKLVWKMEHVVHDLGPNLADVMSKLPFICGDRVAFFYRAKPSKEDPKQQEGWLPLRCCKQHQMQKHYHYGLLWNRRFVEDCVFTLTDQDVAASWRFGHMPANA